MKIKLIALGVMLAAAGGSVNAAIDAGASNSDPTLSGNGEMFFNIWDANGSYTRDLGLRIDTFQTALAGAGSVSFDWTPDATFNTFMAGVVDASALQWNILALDGVGARRLLTTYTPPEASPTKKDDIIRTAVGSVQGFASNVNAVENNTPYSVNESIMVDTSSLAYAGKSSFSDNIGGLLNFSNAGTLANNTYATGVGFMRIDAKATGINPSVYNEYLDNSMAVNAYLDSSNTLHIAAVPEAETWAMMLAGLGLVGFMARRRLVA